MFQGFDRAVPIARGRSRPLPSKYSSYTKVHSVIYDSESVLDLSVFSPRETSPDSHTRRSRLDSGLGFQVKVLKPLKVFPIGSEAIAEMLT